MYSVAAGHEWKSQGNVEAVRSDGTKTVIFDKSDLDYLDGRIDAIEADVSTGKENLANALNPLGTNPSLGTPLSGTSTFNELMEAINHSQAIPDKTIGESVSIATEDYELASKVTGQTINSDTKISAATADNLSLGTSAWVDGSLLIGTGADNKNYYNSALLKNKHTIKVVCNERNRFGETAAISSGTIQIYVDNVLTYTMNIGIFTRSWDPGDSDVKTGSFEIN